MTVDRPTERRFNRLRAWNIAVGLILAAQAIIIAVVRAHFVEREG